MGKRQKGLSNWMRFCVTLLVLAVFCGQARAESQENEYKGISDPFGDPSNYEFADDEREDKEFFHLGRYLMLGFDMGVGLFSGGLGRTNSPGFSLGARLVYFFDRSLALETAVHYSAHLDSVRPNSSQGVDIDTTLLPITLGFRYYFDTKNAPKAIAIANPYVGMGAGLYVRSQNITQITSGLNLSSAPNSSNTSFGAWAAGGVEFPFYRKYLYLGLDLRYHFIFFPDEADTFGGILQEGSRGGDFFSTHVSITYNF